MRPGDWNFTNREPAPSCQVQQFRIESPTLNLLQGKDRLRTAPGKSLETTLRILESQTQNVAQRQVEDAPENPPIKRLPSNLQSSVQPARSNRDVCPVG